MYIVYSKDNCPFCVQAKDLLISKGLEYKEIKLTEQHDIDEFKSRGFRTVPQIFEDDKLIGTFNELRAHLKNVRDAWPDNPLEG